MGSGIKWCQFFFSPAKGKRSRQENELTPFVPREIPDHHAPFVMLGLAAAANSAPLAEDGFRQRLALDGDGRILGIVVVDVEGGVGQAADEAACHHLPVKLVDGKRLSLPG